MPLRKHEREFDLVVFGATGYTGKLTAENVASHLPTNLKWAVAGRSESQLRAVVAKCASLNPDRAPPAVEVCALDHDSLAVLAKKTFVLISTVGPFGKYGEFAFKACAESGTHYVDCTGEVPFVYRMIRKYEAAAKASGALMFPQSAIESAPADLLTWTLANTVRRRFDAPVGDVTISLHRLDAAPSGGTLDSALSLLDNFTARELRASHVPFALSPVPNPSPTPKPPRSLLTRLTGLVTLPILGLQTSSIGALTDAAIVERTWGLLRALPSRTGQQPLYGDRFRYAEYMRPRNRLHGALVHYGLTLLFLVIVTPPVKALVRRFVTLPGDGPDLAVAARDRIEFRGIAEPDLDGERQEEEEERVWGRCWYNGSLYYLSGLLIAQAAATILEDDVELPGGIYTPAILGQGYVDRLERTGFHFESKIVSA